MKKSTDYQVGDQVSGTFLGASGEHPLTKHCAAAGTYRGTCELWQCGGFLYEPTLGFQLGTVLPEFNGVILGTV